MKKFKNLMTKMSDEIKELGKKFPLTMLLILFVTILYTIVIDQDFSRNTEEILEKIYGFCMIWGVGTIFTETWFMKKTNKMISYGITGVVSFIFVQILWADLKDETAAMILRFLATYILILILLSIYKSIQNANLKFEEYVLKLFRDLFNTTATYIILNIGVIIVTSIFVQLILDGHYGSVLERLFVLLFGLFYMPSMVYTFSGISKKEVNSFIKGLVLYVLLPLTVVAIAIIYLYIAKIILLRDMPQNMIYRILAGIFIVAFPMWNMASNYSQDKKWIRNIVKILPYAYAPFILLEIYSIGTRIAQFGITPMRYVSCAFIVFQVIALALTFYKKNQTISSLCLYGCIFVLVMLVSPWNYENVSNWSQKGIIEKVMTQSTNFEELSNEDKTRVYSAYDYLKYEINGEKWIPSYLSEETKEQIEKYENSERRNDHYPTYVSLDCKLEGLDIKEYSQITSVASQSRSDDTTITLEKWGKKIDFKEKVEEIIDRYDNSQADLEEYFENNNIIKINDTEDFYIERISFSYYKNNGTFNYVYVEGYLLER